MLRKMMLRRKTDPKTGTHTLCEPAQSKCTWTFHKSHFTRKFTGQMSEPIVSPERRHTLCAACAVEIHLDISQQPLYTDMYRKKSGAQSDRVRPERGHTHFVRAYAVETHLDISEPICVRIYKENAGAQCEARTQTHTLREPAQSKCTWAFHKCHFVREFKGNAGAPTHAAGFAQACLHFNISQKPLYTETYK